MQEAPLLKARMPRATGPGMGGPGNLNARDHKEVRRKFSYRFYGDSPKALGTKRLGRCILLGDSTYLSCAAIPRGWLSVIVVTPQHFS